MSDTVKVARAKAPGAVKIKNEPIGDAAVKNIHKLLVPESVSSITEYGSQYGLRTSVIEFTKDDLSITSDGSDGGWGTLKLATFPKGRILVHGATGTLSNVDVSDATNISDTGSGDYSFGTGGTSNTTLDGTAVDLGPSADLIDPFVEGVGSADSSSVLSSSDLFDGTGTAETINLNIAFDEGDATDDDDIAVTGKLIVQWSYLADF